jgi:hypothetical protein
VKAGRSPQQELCHWHAKKGAKWPASVFTGEPNFTPADCQSPLVYHLYGQLQLPHSLVLTEDDYFDYLIGINTNFHHIPIGVKTLFSQKALLFIGFRLDEWDFRVLFRYILSLGDKGELHPEHDHIAVQIEPEEGRNADPRKARRYLQGYFQRSKIYIYWGRAEDFIRQLWQEWEKVHPQELPR